MDVSGSPPQRQSFLSGFMPRRTRSSSVPPPPELDSSPSANRRRAGLPPPTTARQLQPQQQQPAATPSNTTQAAAHSSGGHFPIVTSATGLSNILRRTRRDSTGPPPTDSPTSPPTQTDPTMSVDAPSANAPAPTPGQAHRIRLVPHLESTRSLPFEPIIRDPIENGSVLKVGRFTDRQVPAATSANAHNSLKIAFKSKVVSRGHAELWVESGGKFFIKDTSSSSGTFLNHVRLSAPGQPSRPFPIKDGDVIQLGVDYQGGQQEIYRCVKIKVEVGRGWQSAANAFNTNALRQLSGLGVSNVAPSRLMAGPNGHTTDVTLPSTSAALTPSKSSPATAQCSGTDCCICLFPVTVCQALFIAPCSHAFHYKCMRPMLIMHHPGFSCPLCRTFADLETDVEVEPLPEPVTIKPAATLANIDEGRPAPVIEDNAGEDLAMRDDEHEQARVAAEGHPDRTQAEDDADAESAHGFEEEVEAMVTSENEREERERSGSHSLGSGTRQSSRARDDEAEAFEDDDHDEGEEGHDESGSAGGSGTDLATAATPLNSTFLSLVGRNLNACPLPPPNSTTRQLERDIFGDDDSNSNSDGGVGTLTAGPSTRSRTAARLGGVVGKRKR